MADTVVGFSDAAGKAVPARVAEQAPPEPYVPGSGDKFPAKLRLVLAGYVGTACGLFAGALAVAAVFLLFFVDDAFLFFFVDDVDPDDDTVFLLASLAPYPVGACIWGLWRAFITLEARI